MSTVLRPESVVTIGGVTFPVNEGEASLDATGIPYAAARLTLPRTAAAAALDATTVVRARVTGRDLAAGTERTFDLIVSDVDDDESNGGAIALTLSGDEWLLEQYRALSDDAGPAAHQASLRAVCNYVLGKVGAHLEAGAADADVTARWNLSNDITNPGPRVSTAGWSAEAEAGAAAGGFVNVPGPDGAALFVYEVTAAAGDWIQARVQTVRITPGRTVTMSAHGSLGAVAGLIVAGIAWYDASGASVGEAFGGELAVPAGAWRRASVTATPPPGAAAGVLLLRGIGPQTRLLACRAANNPGPDLVPYFDGATPADAAYAYAWTGEPNASVSTRTIIAANQSRDPEAFNWTAGTSARDFLTPLISAAGLRLFADEARRWNLIDPTTYTVPGVVDISAEITTRRRNRQTPADNPTGVLVRYSWRDRDGNQQEHIDTAGTPERVHEVDISRPFPGSGAAARILALRQQQGRSQESTTAADWRASPFMDTTGAAGVLGRVRAVAWGLTGGQMTITRDAQTD